MSGMYQKILAKYNHQVPRYTSYPPATRLAPPPQAFSYASWLENAHGEISLYVHIPFCARLCHYCGCNMRVVNTYDPIMDYLTLLKVEIRMVRQHLQKEVVVSHIHFGGGTPTMLKPADFQDIMDVIYDEFAVKTDAEISIEGDPRNMSEAKIATYAKCGVNRVSLGVQDFNEDVMEGVNRPQPFYMTHQTVQLCRDYGLQNINFDLMYGLPGQTVEKTRKTIDLAILFKPSRISYFGYAHVPWVKKHMKLLEGGVPSSKERFDIQEMGAYMLNQAGYLSIGIDHFVLPDDSMAKACHDHKLHRNFQGYTTDRAPNLIGFGASSIGEFTQGYHQNAHDIKTYKEKIEANEFPTSKILELEKRDFPVKKIVEDLMCYLMVDLSAICTKYELPCTSFDGHILKLAEMEEDGVVSIIGRVVIVNPEFRVLARVVCAVFDDYSIDDDRFQRHAMAV